MESGKVSCDVVTSLSILAVTYYEIMHDWYFDLINLKYETSI